MMTTERIAMLVKEFVSNVMAQNEAPTARIGNQHARRYSDAAKELLGLGENAIDAFAVLLNHDDSAVRVMAAACLLKDRTDQAVATLRPIAAGWGLPALGAQMTLERYEKGILTIEGLNDD